MNVTSALLVWSLGAGVLFFESGNAPDVAFFPTLGAMTAIFLCALAIPIGFYTGSRDLADKWAAVAVYTIIMLYCVSIVHGIALESGLW